MAGSTVMPTNNKGRLTELSKGTFWGVLVSFFLFYQLVDISVH